MGVRVPSSAQSLYNTLNFNELGVFSLKTDTELTQDNILTLNALFEEFKKKMQSKENSQGVNIKYYPATLKTSSNRWRIEFYSLNPYSQSLERVVYRVDKIKKKFGNLVVARRELNKHCEIINYKLLMGWSPFVDCSSIKEIISIKDASLKFLSIKTKDLREESIRSYRSYINIFIEWLSFQNKDTMITQDFTKYDAVNYLDWITTNKKVSANTWNNYRSFMITLFEWLIERGYYNVNHFAKIKSKKRTEKNRIIIPLEDRKLIFEDLKENNINFLMFLFFEYYSLMRPSEIFRMRIKDIKINAQIIELEGEQTKNTYNRNIVIPDKFMPVLKDYLARIKVDSYDKDLYLFSRKFVPGDFKLRAKDAGKVWIELRKKFNFPAQYKVYSLRDTSITSMLMSGIPAKVVQKHADHHDLTITSRYADHVTPEMNKQIKENFPEF